jgi:hypothetical protein
VCLEELRAAETAAAELEAASGCPPPHATAATAVATMSAAAPGGARVELATDGGVAGVAITTASVAFRALCSTWLSTHTSLRPPGRMFCNRRNCHQLQECARDELAKEGGVADRLRRMKDAEAAAAADLEAAKRALEEEARRELTAEGGVQQRLRKLKVCCTAMCFSFYCTEAPVYIRVVVLHVYTCIDCRALEEDGAPRADGRGRRAAAPAQTQGTSSRVHHTAV